MGPAYGATLLEEVKWIEHCQRIRVGIDELGNNVIEVPEAEAFRQPHRLIVLSNDETVALIDALNIMVGAPKGGSIVTDPILE